MKRNLLILTGIIFMAALVHGVSRRSETSKLHPASSAVITKASDKAAPDFELDSLDGRKLKLSDFRGQAVVLNFWATYCAPCRIEMPWLVDFSRKYKGQGLEIVGVSLDDGTQDQVDAFVKEMKVNYAILRGNHSVADAYGGVRFLPQTFLIDREGRIVKSLIGIKNESEFEAALKELLVPQPARSM